MVFEIISSLILFAIGLIIPGYCLSLAFFPKKISLFERIILLLAFGITLVPLVLLLENTLFKIKLDFISVLINLIGISLLGLIAYLIRIKKLTAKK